MSTTTDVLSLFKYDPVADADSTFNITQGLNNNWDKIDTALLLAIAAAGAYNPEESYAVGDYCTYKGKLHKCSTAIPTGETWTEAHWTATTVAAELAELSSQLSNKADGFRRAITSGEDLDTFFEWGSYYITAVASSGVANVPKETALHLYVMRADGDKNGANVSRTIQIVVESSIGSNNLWVRRHNDSGWGDWALISTATPPQRYDLPLENGFSANGTCKYFKTQENIVNLSGGVTGSFPANQDTKIGTLPEGFRPSGTCRRGAVTSAGTAYIEIRADGSVWIHPFNSAGTYAFFDADFIAIS